MGGNGHGLRTEGAIYASILAEESKEFSYREEQYGQQEQGQSLLWPLDDDNQQKPTRTYLVLFHLLSEKDATTFVEDLHGKPFTSLDETVKCSVHRVVALHVQRHESEGQGLLDLASSVGLRDSRRHWSIGAPGAFGCWRRI